MTCSLRCLPALPCHLLSQCAHSCSTLRPLQVNLPIGTVDGLPVGLGLIGPPGSDEDLLQLTEQLMGVLR